MKLSFPLLVSYLSNHLEHSIAMHVSRGGKSVQSCSSLRVSHSSSTSGMILVTSVDSV